MIIKLEATSEEESAFLHSLREQRAAGSHIYIDIGAGARHDADKALRLDVPADKEDIAHVYTILNHHAIAVLLARTQEASSPENTLRTVC